MHFLHAINSDRQTRLLNVFGQIAMFWEIKKRIFPQEHKETTKNIHHNNAPTGTRNWHITVKFSSVATGANLQSCAA